MSSEHPTIIGTNANGGAAASASPVGAAAAAGLNGNASDGKPVRQALTAQHSNVKGESSNLGTFGVKSGLAQMLKGGVIMDVINVEQARIAEEAGACAVMALERVPADIRQDGGVARMSDPQMIREIINAVSIPVMAKCRIGHFVEAQILQSLNVDYIDESEVLTPADDYHHINKHGFKVCGAGTMGRHRPKRIYLTWPESRALTLSFHATPPGPLCLRLPQSR